MTRRRSIQPMAQDSEHEVTRLLAAVRGGDNAAFERLYPMVYEELRRAARRQLAGERLDHTLDTAGLVNEAYLKLVDAPSTPAEGRQHFVRIAARAMRQVLVDHARKRRAEKRGGEWIRTSIESKQLGSAPPAEEILALDTALDKLGAIDPRLRQIVEYRFYAGLSENEIAELLGVTTRTVQRDWVKARAWLYSELYPDGT